jgi:hypothetical protein
MRGKKTAVWDDRDKKCGKKIKNKNKKPMSNV